MKRVLILIAAVLALIALLLTVAWWWLTASASGAGFALGQAASRLERLEYRHIEGGLAGGLVLEDVVFAQAGLQARARRLELAVDIDLFPLAVNVERLLARDLDVRLPPAAPEPAAAEPFVPGDWRAPLPVRVDRLDIDGLKLVDADDAVLAELAHIELAGRYSEALELDRFVVEADPALAGIDPASGDRLRVQASGTLGMASPWPVDLQLTLAAPVAEDLSEELDLALSGRLERIEVAIEARGPLTARGRLALGGLPAVERLDGELELDGRLIDWPGLPVAAETFSLAASGRLQRWQARLSGRVEAPDLPPADVNLGLRAEPVDGVPALTIEQGRVDWLDGQITLDGNVRLAQPPSADLDLRLKALDFTALYPDWPDQARLSGRMQARFADGRLDVEPLELSARPSPLTVTGRLGFDTGSQTLEAALKWSDLVWPPVLDAAAEPLFSSESGRLDASGTLAEWNAELEAWMKLPEQPRARVELDASGGPDQARIDAGRVRFDGAGSVAIQGRVGWAPEPTAGLVLELAGFDPGAFVPELPGRVDGRLELGLQSLAPLAGRVGITRLSGALRGQPLSGSGAVAIADSAVADADLDLALGDNRVALGRGDDQRWQVDLEAARLGQLWPGLGGRVAGQVTLAPETGRAEWQLTGQSLIWADYRAERLDSSGWVRWRGAPALDAEIVAEAVDLNPWERLERVELTLAGDCDAHRAGLQADGTRASLELVASGRLANCLDAPTDWRGALDTLVIGDTPVGRWQLTDTLPVTLESGRLRAGPGCLWTEGEPGRVCLTRLQTGAESHAELAFNALPIDLLLLPADPVFTIGSELKGLARASWTADGIRRITSQLRLGPGVVRMLGDERELVRVRGARLGLTSPEPGALEADFRLELEHQSELVANASIPDLNRPDAIRVDAEARLDLPNLAAFNRLVPQLDQLDGRLLADMHVAGPISAPSLDGELALENAGFTYAPLGSVIEALNARAVFTPDGGTLSGRFAAGDGQATLDGRFDLTGDGGPRAALAVAGNAVRLFDVDWLSLTVSPDLKLAIAPETMRIGGVLTVDRARLGLPPGSETRVAPSPDVVVVGREAETDDAPAAPPARDLIGSVRIELSDDVRMAAAGLSTRLAGTLDLVWPEATNMPNARGAIRLVDGSYRAYGQSLEVTEGKVAFTGNPVANPTLDIVAVRQIFGDPQVEQAGVRISGPAQDPEIELFTAPPTSREKALAYILTGANFDHASGQGAFSVGFWVLPNVFVSYGLGLFDTGNVLAARWELSRRWGLRATSGERDTGADLSFIIDR